jgi:hypothetical protein
MTIEVAASNQLQKYRSAVEAEVAVQIATAQAEI